MFNPMLGHTTNGVIALLALGLGYIVCSLAKKEAGALRVIGYFIGVSIIVISSMLIIGKILLAAKICPIMGGKLPMPMSSTVPKK